jgi:hypothetical protein
VDHLAGGQLGFDGIEEADELLVAVALHAAANDLALRFCALLRLAATASIRARSAALTVTMIPLHIHETRTLASPRESPNGLNRQIASTTLSL